MKKLLILGAFALLTATLFSCTADEYDNTKTNNTTIYADGPGDLPIVVPPPPPPTK